MSDDAREREMQDRPIDEAPAAGGADRPRDPPAQSQFKVRYGGPASSGLPIFCL